ncbi:MAG: mechanosensitive ion channel family protein [Snowella sp.]|nr:mechanosensitive ion channel family protein [Snowella sp.]
MNPADAAAQINPFLIFAFQALTALGIKVIGAILLWLVGRWLINFGVKLLSKSLKRQSMDITIVTYITNVVSITLQIILIVAILGFFGIETTSFAALLAAGGIAIGAAWSGLLANFAAGAFLILFRPFNVGDFINAGGVIGTVEEIGLFVTTINTMDNVKTIIGNNKIFADNIQNFSANPYRRVDLVAQLNHSVNVQEAIQLLKDQLAQIPNVMPDPAPDVEILEFNLSGPVLAVRPYCHNNDYWQVYFDTNKTIKEAFGEAGYPVPEQHYQIRQAA